MLHVIILLQLLLLSFEMRKNLEKLKKKMKTTEEKSKEKKN